MFLFFVLLSKAMNKCVTEQGALTCALETPQQGLDMIESALSHGDHLRIAVNIGASEIFDAVIAYNSTSSLSLRV